MLVERDSAMASASSFKPWVAAARYARESGGREVKDEKNERGMEEG